MEGGLFSSFANDTLRKGDTVEVMEPVGKFYTILDPAHKKNYLAFAAGSGITPVLSIIKTTLRTEPNSNFTLVYGNRSRSSIIFFEELEGLKNKFIDRFTFINILSRERTEAAINFGRIDPDKVGFHAYARIFISVKPAKDIQRVAQKLSNLAEVSFLAMISGKYDLELNVQCRDNNHLIELMERMHKIEGIYETETNMYLKVFKIAQPDLDLVKDLWVK